MKGPRSIGVVGGEDANTESCSRPFEEVCDVKHD